VFNSELSNNLGFGGSQAPNQGAETPVWLATNEIGGKVTGKYIEHMREAKCRFSSKKLEINKLFNKCLSFG
jgi:retinol dehydrogenase 12